MREGLRSRTRLGTASGGEGVDHKKTVAVKSEAVDLGDEGLEVQKSTIEKKGEVECGVKQECGFDLNVSPSADVDLAEDGSGKSCLNGGGSILVAEEDRKAKKKHDSNDGVLVGGRVLRPRSKSGDCKRLYYGENDDVVSGDNGEHSGCERVKVKKEHEEADDFLADSCEKEIIKPKKEGDGRRKLKRKRGRPPKIDLKGEDEPGDQLPRKRGRPPLAGRQNHLVTVVTHNRKGKATLRKGKKGLTKSDGAKVNAIGDTNSRNSTGGELEKKEDSLVKRNAVKQLVRDQIKEQLSAAGWTVDFRPRNGREYHDAVYVSLDGHTHWSITLAYKRLKEYYEAGNGEGKAYKPGFKFTPIAEEDFKMLTKVMNKQRKKGGKGGKKVDGVNGKKNKEKSGYGAGMGKSMKRKMKRKTSPNRMPVVRDHKRQKTQNKKRCAPLARNAEEIDSETEGYVLYCGKRTLLAWMIDSGTVLQNGKVHYMPHKSKSAVLDGEITGNGIHCGCCDKIFTISDFELHAGSKLADPLKNIYVGEGTSLLQCLLDSWNKQDESERKGFHFVDVAGEDPNDDTCGVCGDGGDLICCDGCPSTFHQGCLDIKKFPSGDWHCIYCCCKFCGSVSGSSNQRDDNDELIVSKLLTCQLCEEKYHRSCIEANDANTDDSRDVFFCGNRCQELSERLEMLLGVKHEMEDGYSWTFIRRSDVGFDASQIKPQMVECNSKLAVAVSIMDECFMPYIDHRSGINLIHSILYNRGSNFNRLNYSGFVTAILERGDEIISAASIRIRGNQLAEMPFIGTRYMYRRQGMCRRLLNAVEWGLGSLNVELLVIPAISELRETWTSVFGFESLESTSKQILHNKNLLVFPHVDMLQKKISKHKLAGQNLNPSEGQINDETISIESGCHLPDGSLNKVPDIASNAKDHRKSSTDDTCQVVCQAAPEILVMEDNNSIENARDYVTGTCCRAGDSQLNSCWVPCEERQCLTSCIRSEATEGNCVSVSLEVTENFLNQVKVANEAISNSSAENSASCGAERIPLDSQIAFDTRDSKDSGDSIHQDSYKISDSCELRSKTDCGEPNFIGTKEVHAEPVRVSGFHSRPKGDCASCEAASATNVLIHLRSQKITDNKPWMNGTSELADPDLQVDQTARNSAPSLWSPNTASGAALHWASAGSASRGSTEGIVLSNQAS
ncbi:hypothetical protein AAZX31_02G140000 [Glycine max]|uniref:PHD-type domain-containing protein n=3 Tax=Glycine subgen. Soja TaxID=1462606 RepID=I1JF96_SOYBN|nr:uncharacterized protein LOC100784172 [Glycine max]XP_028206510.1 uncharacterized protein LOC114390018 [Glycine soja]KAG4402204.1 hypothetical protein GLYMA_02G146500v4 [Glycine max]KAG5080089.1 hypothetical protein JHK86_004154 [Glycine max]KAH1060358.1 hypothetical protein GYH30_004037 [Glycine max]KAH1060360.1 hypothetical protein GYH30_004037 [Glycine max]KAH1261496.1 Increased DNA methylation 1 [Glycine max]|eukprot:XP_003520206.1 uncharacterized protein LOC100784172 [Glycine max]